MQAALLVLVLCAQAPEAAPPATPQADARAVAVLQRFFSAWEGVRTLTYRMNKQERMRSGAVREEEVRVKLKKPSSVYLAAIKPKPGQEVIYVGTRDPKNIVVHPGSFPDVTLTLDVHGALTTKNQHHLVYHTGFGYGLEVLKKAIERSQKEPHEERLEYGGVVERQGRKAEVAVLFGGTRPSRRIKAKDGETLFAFAARVGQDPYVIFMANPQIDEDDYADELEAGASYTVPAYYCHKSELALDLETNLPLSQTCWDKAGKLFERYEYSELVVNPKLSDLDFDPKNPAYRF